MKALPCCKKKLCGFTIIELMMVISILSILGTIAFLSLQSYSSSARDSTRIENLSNLHKGLSLFQITGGTYPTPEDYVTISASGMDIGYQGYAKDQIVSITKLSKDATKDPLDPTIFTTYSVNINRTKMQLMSFLENGNSITAFLPPLEREVGAIFPAAYANTSPDYTKRTPITKGDTIGILLGNTGNSLNQPVQETQIGVDVALSHTGYTTYFSKNLTSTGTGTSLITNFSINSPDGKLFSKYDKSLVGYWDMETTTLSGTQVLLKDFSGYGNDGICYNGMVSGACGVVGPQFVKEDGMTGKGMSFDGINDKIAYSASFLPSTSAERTLLIKTRFGTGYMTPVSSIVYWGTNGTNNAFELGVFGENLQYGRWGGDINLRKINTSGVEVIGIRYDGNITGTFFDNGKFQNIDLGYPLNTVNGSYGGIGGGRHYNYTGIIDEVRIYNRALSDAEITAFYAFTK